MDQVQKQFDNLSLQQRKPTGFVYSDKTLLHKDPKDKHVERPERVTSIVAKVKEYVSTLANKDIVEVVNSIDPCSIEAVKLAHDQSYFDFIEEMFEEVDGGKVQDVRWFNSDTYANKHTANAARIAVQGTLLSLDKVLNNEWSNAFAALRPPGHHQGHVKTPNGFCVYNNVAIGIKYVREKYNVKKVCVFDWDVHHGDGTEFLTYNDPNTLFISLHRYDLKQFYPGSGHPNNIGGKDAQGFNINVGWNVNSYNQKINLTAGTSEYIYAFTRLLEPIIKEFAPELIIISAGFDSAEGDPLGRCGVTPTGYAFLTQKLQEIQSKIVVVLEGGYNLEAISISAQAVFKVLAGEVLPFKGSNNQQDTTQLVRKSKPNIIGVKAVAETLSHHKNFWKCLEAKELLAYDQVYIGEESLIITGGHLQDFKIKGDKILKKTKKSEQDFYVSLDNKTDLYYEENQQLVNNSIIPKFYGLEDGSIIMENLFLQMPYASIIDIKLGVKNYNPNGSEQKRAQEIQKSKGSSAELGLRVSGVKIKSVTNEQIVDLRSSDSYLSIKTKEEIQSSLLQVLKSNDNEKLNQNALIAAIKFVEELIKFIKTSKRFFRCSSFLFAVDNVSDKFIVKWIDFNYVQPLESDGESPDSKQDDNIIFGLENLHRILKNLTGNQN